jgi:NADPH:quinone reductase-like Zn-dependent oxidoreductase
LEVILTTSKKNLDYVKGLGTKHMLDHSSATVVEDILAGLKGTDFAGVYDAISSPETLKASGKIFHQLGGGTIATVLSTPAGGLPSNVTAVGGENTFRFEALGTLMKNL